MNDLTRWNRAGLARFDYLDGNAAVFLERLRRGLAAAFPEWAAAKADGSTDESEEARKLRIEHLYAANPDDLLWQLTRSFARACHVLGGHLDAYANESYLGTASQWESLRRLVALLDYAPQPQASAAAPLVLLLKDGQAGRIAAGLQVKHNPAAGAPLVFETLTELDADAALNVLYARHHLRCPQALSGTALVLAGEFDKLQSGDPLLLEDERDRQHLSAHLVEGVVLGSERTTVTLTPAIPAGFLKGWTAVHLLAKEKLAPIGPATEGVDEVGHSLQLAASSGDLAAGDIVVIRSADDKPYYRRLKNVHDDRLVFYRAVGALRLKGATVARAITVPLTELAAPPKRRRTEGDTVIDTVFAAGDWSRLAGLWLADLRKLTESGIEREYLPAYRCLHAKYVPVGTDPAAVADDDRPGYTALTLTWEAATDGVDSDADLSLKNPQTLLAPPVGAGPWAVDTFLNKSEHGRVQRELVTALAKQTVAGDFAVLVKGAQLAWARLGSIGLDQEHRQATLSAEGVWQDRGGGPFFLSRTRVHGHFTQQARLVGWQDNATALSGRHVELEAGSLPPGLRRGRALIVGNGTRWTENALTDFDATTDPPWLLLRDPLPAGCTASQLRIHANVVVAGHGEVRPPRVLGSGDGTRDNQQFVLDVPDLSFVADAAMTSGVRADLAVAVAGETWTQVSSLKDSRPADAHYQVRIDEDRKARVQFGDGRHGRRLPSGGNNLRVTFRQGAGAAGNLPPGCLVKLARPHPLLAAVEQPIESSGGADREANADLRTNAPATLLALDRAVSLGDFAQLARGHAAVWQARAFRRPPQLARSEQIEVVVMAAGGGKPSDALRAELQAFLLARAEPGVAVAVTAYEPLGFRLSVTVRVRSAAFDRQTVQEAVRRALIDAFSPEVRQLGQPLYRGEVYRVVDAVAGVENSDCAIVLDATTRAALAQVVETGSEVLLARPAPNQCLLLDASSFTPLAEEFAL